MRDKPFVAGHRGGPLKKEQHIQLIQWACQCVQHVLTLAGKNPDERLVNAILTAKAWTIGKATTGDAMKASLGAHDVARESTDSITTAVARAVGHAVATAHMPDHSLGAALYALKAIKNAGKSIDVERKWQNEQLPSEIMELVLTARSKKEKDLKL